MPVVASVLPKYSSFLKNFRKSAFDPRPGTPTVQKDRLVSLHFGLVACLHVCRSAWKAGCQPTSLTARQTACLPSGKPTGGDIAWLTGCMSARTPACLFACARRECSFEVQMALSRLRSPVLLPARNAQDGPDVGSHPTLPLPGTSPPPAISGQASRRAHRRPCRPQNCAKSMRSPRGLAIRGGLTAGRRVPVGGQAADP
jgi:hypothetical protein